MTKGSSTAKGRRAERAAARHLERRGWRIVARNWRGGGGEIDLVAVSDMTVAFVEVKARANRARALDPVGARQRRHIERAARAFLQMTPTLAAHEARLDLVTVTQGRFGRPRVRHRPGAWGEPA